MNPKMARAAEIRFMGAPAGRLWEDQDGYHFAYDIGYIATEHAKAISLTLPLRPEPYVSRTMFPFFDGLIPEGWLLEIAELNWKLNPRDRMGLLLTCCKECIGAVSVHPIETTAP